MTKKDIIGKIFSGIALLLLYFRKSFFFHVYKLVFPSLSHRLTHSLTGFSVCPMKCLKYRMFVTEFVPVFVLNQKMSFMLFKVFLPVSRLPSSIQSNVFKAKYIIQKLFVAILFCIIS